MALQLEIFFHSSIDIYLTYKEGFTSWLLQVEIDVLAIGSPSFVTSNLTIHSTLMYQPGLVALHHVYGPDTVNLMPRTFVTEHQ